MRHSDAHKGVRNNHYYWEGLAVTATGAVTGDARSLAWGRKVFDHAMGQIEADGSLPLELARGRKALSYHLYAAAPLVMMASILDLDAAPLERLVAYSVAGVANPVGAGRGGWRGPGRPARRARLDRNLAAPRRPPGAGPAHPGR
jgi:poly(beta-D-mannuronate) lyase